MATKVLLTNVAMDLGGGTDLVGVAAVQALLDGGFDVELRTCEPTDWERLAKLFPRVPRVHEESLRPRKPAAGEGGPGLWVRRALGYRRLLRRLWRDRGEDVIVNVNGDLFPSPAHVTYVHYPAAAASMHPGAGPFAGAVSGGLAAALLGAENRHALRRVRPRILVNSSFTREAVQKVLGVPATVLFPPVTLYLPPPAGVTRSASVVTIASFRARKRLDRVLDVAARLPDVRFTILGTSGPQGDEIRSALQRRIEVDGLQGHVSLVADAPREVLERLCWTSKAFLHPAPMEHFGIGIVEAMAAGCVPVVPRSGGQWLDILEAKQGQTGFGYDTPEEAAESIERLLADANLWAEMSRRAQLRSQAFRPEAFAEGFLRTVREVMVDERGSRQRT